MLNSGSLLLTSVYYTLVIFYKLPWCNIQDVVHLYNTPCLLNISSMLTFHFCLFKYFMFNYFRQLMESQIGALILATDISQQNEYLSVFRTHLDRGDLCLEDASHRHFILQVTFCNIFESAIFILEVNHFKYFFFQDKGCLLSKRSQGC